MMSRVEEYDIAHFCIHNDTGAFQNMLKMVRIIFQLENILSASG
jgi:hypothetical protein